MVALVTRTGTSSPPAHAIAGLTLRMSRRPATADGNRLACDDGPHAAPEGDVGQMYANAAYNELRGLIGNCYLIRFLLV